MTKIIDLDADLAFTEEPLHTKQITLFGRQWTLVCDLNAFAITSLAAGDAAAIHGFLGNLVVEAERAEFLAAFGNQRNLDGEKLGRIINKLIEVISEVPTQRPSASSAGGSKVRRAPKSAVTSSGTRAVRSVR